jgi:MBG domain
VGTLQNVSLSGINAGGPTGPDYAGAVSASFAGDSGYDGSSGTGDLTVAKAPATLTLSNLTGHTYDGQPKAATVTTNPANLSGVSITYDGSATAPTNAGSYAVVASLNNSNYQATNATGTLVIGKATPTINWSNPAPITYGTALSSTQLNAQAKGVDANNLAGSYTYTPPSGTKLNAGDNQDLKVDFTPNDTTNYTTATKTVQINVNYDFSVASGAGFLQPINYTAHGIVFDTNVSTFKAGSTVPVKFVLKDANGNVVQAASPPQWLTPTKGSATNQPVDESQYIDLATTGTAYLWNGAHYQYNWASPKTGSGFYWRIGVKLDDDQIYYVNISLR